MSTVVPIRLSDDELAAIERLRGEMARSTWIKRVCQLVVQARASSPQGGAIRITFGGGE
jgi:hypothetical protein